MLDKLLASFAYPLGFALIALLVAGFAVAGGARRSGSVAIILIALSLWVTSTPLFARWALGTLERQYPETSVQSYKPADAIILLGGALSPPGLIEPYPDLGEASDRVVHALRIYKAGLAPKILISGGNVFPDGRMSEGEALAEVLESWGVDRGAILVEGVSKSTFENARESARVWQREGFHSGLLVTSAMHMPRALAVFRKAGLTVEPASTDERSEHALPPFPLSFFPDAEASIRLLWRSKSGLG